jgi:hypothetical protein
MLPTDATANDFAPCMAWVPSVVLTMIFHAFLEFVVPYEPTVIRPGKVAKRPFKKIRRLFE